jgi:hypothetical protein
LQFNSGALDDHSQSGAATMNPVMHVIKDEPATLTRWLFGAVLVAILGSVLWMFISVKVNGPKMRAMIESQKAEELEQENRVFCAKFGVTFGTSTFATCASELAQIRRQHEERLNRDPGIL